MPVSKNKRKSKRGRRRKENLAKAATAFGDGGYPDQFDHPPQSAPTPPAPPDAGLEEQTSTETPGYSMKSAPSTTRRVMLLTAVILVAVTLLRPSWALAQVGAPVEFTFDFETDAQGWTAGFADLPVNYDQSIYELAHEHSPLPDGPEGSGIYVQGHNRSDDLFMFLKRQVDGLRPNTEYAVSVSLDLATNVPAGLVGIGGSPGESVFVKAGASTPEPVAVENGNRHLRMNIDKGNQARGGESMVVLGNVAHPQVLGREYRIKTLDNLDIPLSVTADGEGRVWLIVGTDSGFEGLTSLYYARISYTMTPVQPPGSGGPTPTPEPPATPEPEPTATSTSQPPPTVVATLPGGPTPTAGSAPTTGSTQVPEPTATAEPTTAPEPTPEPIATRLPEATLSAGPTKAPTDETELGSTFPAWLIAVLVLAGLSIAGVAALAVWRRRPAR